MTMTLPAIEDLYPLSPTQQGLLFHSLYGPASGVYMVQVGFTVRGRLNLEAFCRAWQWLVQRHPVLRTAFTWDALEEPLQVVGRQATLPIDIQDWQTKPREAQAQELADWLERDRRQGFDLTAAPLMRLTILHLTPDTCRIIWSYHHLLLDGWSVPLLLRELLLGYQSFEQGHPPTLDTPRPYRDYIAWLKQQDTAAATQFWQQRLQGISAPTPLGIDRPRRLEGATPAHYGVQQRSLSSELTDELRSHAQTHRLTLNTLVQGAWAVVLGRYSGESEVLFGSTCAGRPPTLSGAEAIVGLFINTLPMRVNLAPDQPVNTWLQQLQNQQLDQQPYEFTPLVQIHDSSDIPRSLPLFESVVVFENYPVEPALKRGIQTLAIEDVTTAEQTNYPLTLFALAQHTLDLKVQYDCDRFTPDAIERLLGNLETVLTGFLTHPEQPIGTLPLLTPAEQQQLQTWNQTQQPIPECCVHELIADQAKTTPDATAVIFEDTTLSYRELDQRANQLTNYLLEKGVQSGDRVALCLERSAELVITLLAILKTGATYVPLDPTYPAERLRFILEDAQVSLLITASLSRVDNARMVDRLTANSMVGSAHPTSPPGRVGTAHLPIEAITNNTLPILDISDLSYPPPLLPTHPPTHPPSTLAYLIYTSGSTGIPKGVLVPHGGLTNLTEDKIRVCDVRPGDCVLQFFSFSFDASIPEIVMALATGARLLLAPNETLLPGPGLADLLRRHSVTHITITPSALVSVPYGDFPDLRMVLVGGEAPSPELIHTWSQGSRFINAYGPTETTVNASMVPCGNGHPVQPTLRPSANKQLYILDDQLQPLPIGAIGELHIGGTGLARGYLNRPELTAEKFVPNPFFQGIGNGEQGIGNGEQGTSSTPYSLFPISYSLLYKTGDLACYLPDGRIKLLGRIDDQAKIRGFRVEPAEIENQLNQHPDVKASVVLVREDVPGDKRLVAYVVKAEESFKFSVLSSQLDSTQNSKLKTQNSPTPSLRQFLADKLPHYLIPSVFVELGALPLTPNGKVDVRSLPAPTLESPEVSYVAPRSEVEITLADIFAQVLGVERVGIHDDFFELGGHSLLATQLVAQVLNRFDVEVTVIDLFKATTVAALAQRIEQKQLLAQLQTRPLEDDADREEFAL